MFTVQSVLCVALQGAGYFCVTVASSHEHCVMQEKHTFLPGCILFPVTGYLSLPGMCALRIIAASEFTAPFEGKRKMMSYGRELRRSGSFDAAVG